MPRKPRRADWGSVTQVESAAYASNQFDAGWTWA